ncbi:MAG: hypothetical protein CMI36_12285 [Owenweeksia sp.]|nr:hypothetical protein [Owenweeksia sp.]MBF99762.1 hypothetical protein [Owenweeksia sp.]HCQ16707.1 hypothetical protein [Cryomorphaceae bacterium]|tara:strand:+ start:3353 stop:3829 length:477 start_codon:yes stop_codon:yes gene_type:complete
MIHTLLVSFMSILLGHPFHTSITTCEYNGETDNLELSIRVFTDDLEQAIGQALENRKPGTSMAKDSALQKYVGEHLGIRAGGVDLKPLYIGRETEYDITYLYLEVPSFPEREKKYQVKQTILFDQFEDQSNIVHLKIGGRNQSQFYVPGETFKPLLFE